MKRIVVVGGGFSGLHLIRRLEGRLSRDDAQITVIDQNNFHLFTPLLYQVATGELPPHAIGYPLRAALSPAGHRFVRDTVERIDLAAKVVHTTDGEYAYDHVVIVPGSVTNDYGIPGVREHALPLKWLPDGRAVRHRILSTFEDAATEPNAEIRREKLSFVIVGAGPVGIELAASLRDLMDHTLRGIYPTIDFTSEPRITVIDTAGRILPAMDERLSRIAMKRMDKLRVDVRLRTSVSEVTEEGVATKDAGTGDGVTTDRSFLRSQSVIWAGGVKANPLLATLDLPRSRDGRLAVDEYFRAGGRDDVLSFGDAAAFLQDGKPLPQLAQVAVLEAPAAARNLAHLVRGEPLEAYRYHRKGDLVALGRTSAGAEFARFGNIVLSGLPAWTVWRVNYLMQLVGVRNRGTLLVEWLLSYFSRRIVVDIP